MWAFAVESDWKKLFGRVLLTKQREVTRAGGWAFCDGFYCRCFPMFPDVSWCFLMFPDVSRCFPMFPDVSRCFPMLPDVSRCFPMLPDVSRCFPMFPDVSWCFPMFPDVSRCFLMFPDVSWCFLSWLKNWMKQTRLSSSTVWTWPQRLFSFLSHFHFNVKNLQLSGNNSIVAASAEKV